MERTTLPRRLAWQLAKVVEVRPETPSVKSLVLEVPEWTPHLPGQHVDVRLTAEDGYQAQRSYSISSPPKASHVTLTVERLDDGEVSPYLTDVLRAGDKLELRGPIGGYFTWEVSQGGPLMLIAGGSGVSPLMAMLRYLTRSEKPIPARLLLSSRTLADIIFQEELERLVAQNTNVEVFHTLTREQPLGWQGYARRIDREMLKDLLWPAARRPRIFICGPTALVEGVASACVELGHEPGFVKTERFGPTGG